MTAPTRGEGSPNLAAGILIVYRLMMTAKSMTARSSSPAWLPGEGESGHWEERVLLG